MSLVYAISTISDGNMAMSKDHANKSEVLKNRAEFLAKSNISPQDCTRVTTTYNEGVNFRRYREVDESNKGEGMFDGNIDAADALVTRQLEHGLFLPLADCVGAVIFDPKQQILMLSHIGRHSLEQFGARESVNFLVSNYGCQPEELLIWLTPAPGIEKYPLYAFNSRAFKDVVFEQLTQAGINTENITDDPTDTTSDPRYYSHSQYLAGHQDEDGRYAIVAMMRSD